MPKRGKRSNGNSVALDVMTPQLLAASGDIESLKYLIQLDGITIKERDENHATLLHHAAAANQVAVMQYLIDSGIDLNATDRNGCTALHAAVLQGHTDAIHLLLQSGINDRVLDKDSNAALHLAVQRTDTNVLAAFLEHPEVDMMVPGYRKRTPLHIISERDNLDACELFHSHFIDSEHGKNNLRLCARDKDELTAIHLAARSGSHRIINMFLENSKLHGYLPEVLLGFLDEENSTPLHAAIDSGHTKVVEVLLKHGADPLIFKDDQVPPFLLACSQGKLDIVQIILKSNKDAISCRDMYGQNCLHHSARAINSSHMIMFLVSEGAQVDCFSNKGQTPLMTSIITGGVSGVSTLLELGADPFLKDHKGYNALHYAVTQGRSRIAIMLLDLPSASKLVLENNNEGNSPFHLALELGFCGLNNMIAMIQQDFKNIKDSQGNNFLHLAARGGNENTLRVLLEIPECLKLLNELNNGGTTPLHLAASKGHKQCVEVLLSHGAMIHRCYNGTTPFMVACVCGHIEVAQILFSAHPFQLKWTDDQGQNALHHGALSSNPEMLTYLLDIGVPITHNFDLESFFDKLVEKNDTKCIATVLKHNRYQECLDLVSPIHPHPMISLITHMPEMARRVLDRSHTKADLTSTNPDYWEKFDFKYLCLLKCQETSKDPTADVKEIEETPVVRYKRRSTVGPALESKKKYKIAHLEALMTMVEHKRGFLLTHPVSHAYLESKWKNYGKWLNSIISSFVFFQVFFLSLFTVLIPNPSDVQAADINCLNETNGTSTNGTSTNGTDGCLEFSNGANACRFISLIFTCLNFIVWLVFVIELKRKALDILENLNVPITLISVTFTIYYLIPTKGLNGAHWEAGAVAVFFAWFSLILKMQTFSTIGVYITMFLAITRRVFQVLLMCFVLVIAFALSFYILVGNWSEFSTIGYSLFVNFGHFLEGIDYVAFVQEGVDGNLQFHWLTFTFVVALVILLGVVDMNLLIGLAVGDIEEIQSNAIVEAKVKDVNFFITMDLTIPSRLMRWLDKPLVIVYPNRKVSILTKVWRFTKWLLTARDTELNVAEDQKSSEIMELRERIEELSLSQERILHTLNQLNETILTKFNADIVKQVQ